jgi:hypothetical protein
LLLGGVGIVQGGEQQRPLAHPRPRTAAEQQGQTPPALSSLIHDVELTANTKSGGT